MNLDTERRIGSPHVPQVLGRARLAPLARHIPLLEALQTLTRTARGRELV